MKKETEGLIAVSQGQALPTRLRKVHIEKQTGTGHAARKKKRYFTSSESAVNLHSVIKLHRMFFRD